MKLPRWKTIQRIWITTGLTGTVIFITWTLVAARAQGVARAALGSDARVTVATEEHHWSFTPRSPAAAGLMFFPGAGVDPVAYAPLLRAIAGEGYVAILIQVPRRGLFGGAEGSEVSDRARSAAARAPVRRWVAAGHSRGGVIACDVVRHGFPGLAGAVLLGTTHPRDFSLAGTTIPITRVYGTRDTIADVEKMERTRANLPPSARIVRIDGGNHSQFGYYGFQPGDWPATISREAQQTMVRQAILDALTAASK